jgi:hypothetical protein
MPDELGRFRAKNQPVERAFETVAQRLGPMI